MRVFCDYLGGLQFGQVALSHGENRIDDDVWAKALESLNPAIAEVWFGGANPLAWVMADMDQQLFEALAEPLPTPTDDPPPDPPLPLARDKIAAAEKATTLAELDELENGEFRKTVLKAINKRRVLLSEGV